VQVITPLEIIFDRVVSISVNPFADMSANESNPSLSHEVDLIKQSLTRLTKLLQVGLGQAGSDIIAKNLSSGSFSALQAGTRLDAVFGFCDIRNFTDCCEILQEVGFCFPFI
jgi:hypothetical protein